jgi:HEAT repeat protein
VAAKVRELAQERQARAIDVLTELMESDDERVRLAAANSLLDRGSGRPSSEAELLSVRFRMEEALKRELSELSDEQLDQLAAGTSQQGTIDGFAAVAHTDETTTNEEGN